MLKMPIRTKLTSKSVLVALGGNLKSSVGPPEMTLRYALANLRLRTNSLIRKSNFFFTPCFPDGFGPDYVNGALEFNFKGEARELLDILHKIEVMFGRVRNTRWGGRVLDLDLVAFGDDIAPSIESYLQWRNMPLEKQIEQIPKELILPHPRLQERAFVLGPLMDIAPDWCHPVLGLTVREMYGLLPLADRDDLRVLPEP